MHKHRKCQDKFRTHIQPPTLSPAFVRLTSADLISLPASSDSGARLIPIAYLLQTSSYPPTSGIHPSSSCSVSTTHTCTHPVPSVHLSPAGSSHFSCTWATHIYSSHIHSSRTVGYWLDSRSLFPSGGKPENQTYGNWKTRCIESGKPDVLKPDVLTWMSEHLAKESIAAPLPTRLPTLVLTQ